MNVEVEVLMSILKLTKEGPIAHELVNMDARIPKDVSMKLLRKLQKDNLVNVSGNIVEAKASQRLEMAFRAMKGGAGAERVSNLLRWREFEGVAAVAFEQNGYSVVKNLRFKHGGRRWEIDVVAYKKPVIVCVDCKHWHHGLHKSVLERIAEEQIKRTKALIGSLPNPAAKLLDISCSGLKVVPAILSLFVDRFRFCRGIPVVPVMQLQDFLNRLPVHIELLDYLTPSCLRGTSSKQKSIDNSY